LGVYFELIVDELLDNDSLVHRFSLTIPTTFPLWTLMVQNPWPLSSPSVQPYHPTGVYAAGVVGGVAVLDGFGLIGFGSLSDRMGGKHVVF